MAHDQFEDPHQTMGRRGGRLVVAGVVGACALGVGLGLWARPSTGERLGEAAPEPEAEAKVAADRRLQIVVDDTPAPLGPPLEVMPADLGPPAHHVVTPRVPSSPEPVAPARPTAGLMKVTAPVAGPVAQLPPPDARPKAEARADRPKAERAEQAPKSGKAKTAGKREKPLKTAKAKPGKQAKADRPAPRKPASETAAAKMPKAVERAPKPTRAKVEKAEARKVEAKKAQAKKDGGKKAARAAEAKVAKAPPKPKAKPVEKAVVRPKPPAPRGEDPMRVARAAPPKVAARAAPCASADPGEALVCADPRLNQRDRQLRRAYREAEAAGVPANALVRQQERWRAARAAAARDGSWAVEDVYEARIAELKDLARDARDY